MSGTDAKDFATSAGGTGDTSQGQNSEVPKPSKAPHGYFALATHETKEDTAAATPTGMPLFVAPNFAKDSAGDELDDAPKLPHEQTPFGNPREDPLSPTQTRS